MDPMSVAIIMKDVESLADALAQPRDYSLLPEGLTCLKRRENILVLNLIHWLERPGSGFRPGTES